MLRAIAAIIAGLLAGGCALLPAVGRIPATMRRGLPQRRALSGHD